MKIIEAKTVQELPKNSYAYSGILPAVAVKRFKEKFNREPKVVYRFVLDGSIYIEITPEDLGWEKESIKRE